MIEKWLEVVKKAGAIVLRAHGDKGIRQKSGETDLVTQYDVEVQNFLTEKLSALVPGCSFFGEEGTGNKTLTAGWCFIIDPIDGTTNFIKGYGHCCVSVGLAKDREMVCGAVFDPFANELFYAEKGKGAFLNGRPIRCSDCDLSKALVTFGTCPYEHELADKTFDTAKKLFLNSLEIRRGGSGALDICYVASGKCDLYFEYILRPWDFAAATLILQEAGGLAMTTDGAPIDFSKTSSYLCGNEKTTKAFFELTGKS